MKNIMCIILINASLLAFAWQLPEGDLSGKILDLQNNPVENVSLVFSHEHDPEFKLTTETNAAGAFVARNVKTGYVVVKASKEGYPSREFKYTQEGKKMRQIFRMSKEGTTYESLGPQPKLSGTLKDTSGNPLADANLKIYSDDLPGWEQIIKTDANGFFEAPSLENALVSIHANKEGYRDQIYQFDQEKSDYTVKDFKVQTLEEYFAEIGQEMPGKREMTPEEQAVDYYNKAVDPYKAKDYQQAKIFAKKSFDANPNQLETIKILVYSSYNLKEFKDSLFYAEKYLELKPGDEGMAQYARESARMTDDKALVKKYKEELKKSGALTPSSIYNDAVTAINGGNDEEGKKLLTEVIGMDASFAEAYNQLGKINIREGDFETAVSNFKLFLKNAPKDHQERQEITDLIVSLSE